MKKWLLALTAVFFLWAWVPGTGVTEVSAAAKTGTTSDGFSYKISKDNTVEITKYKGKKKKLEFPDKIKGKKVTRVGKAAVKGNKYVSSIEVPDSVKVVAVDAFDNCKNLTTIKLGKNVEKICAKEDEDSTYLAGSAADKMKLGKKFKTFEVNCGNKFFSSKDGVLFERGLLNNPSFVCLVKCPPAKKGIYEVPQGVNGVRLDAFCDTQISTLTFPASVELILGFYANEKECNYKIAEYKVDEANEKYYTKDGVLFVKEYGKYDNPKGEKLLHYPPEKRDVSYQVPEDVLIIEDCAFQEHKYLEEVEIPNTCVGEHSFLGCKKLKRALLSDTVFEGAFYGCRKLTDVEFRSQDSGEKITISEDAFRESGLKSIILPENVRVIEKEAFDQCRSLKWIEFRNKDCHIDMLDAGMRNRTVVYGYLGSTAEKFAQKAGQEFRAIGEPRPEEDFPGTVTGDTIKLSQSSYTYDGKEKRPKVVVKDKFGNKVKDYYYKVTYKNNKNVGEAIVRVKFDNYAYAGTVQTTFVIKPPQSRITKLAAGKNDITLQWKGVKPSQITGYEIQYATSNKFEKENTQTVQVNKRDASKKQLENLEPKKTYYVRIRSYKNIKREGKAERLYSKWSDKRAVKTL